MEALVIAGTISGFIFGVWMHTKYIQRKECQRCKGMGIYQPHPRATHQDPPSNS